MSQNTWTGEVCDAFSAWSNADKRESRSRYDAFEAGAQWALEKAWKSCAGPDEGYLHGCECRGRVRAMLPESEAWK